MAYKRVLLIYCGLYSEYINLTICRFSACLESNIRRMRWRLRIPFL